MTDGTEGETLSTWANLRRRKVVQWGLAYAAGAWVLMQIVAYFSGTFDWSRQIQQLVTVAVLVGAPIVLALAWYHGDRGQQRVTGSELAVLTLLLMIGGGLLWLYAQRSVPTTDTVAATQPAPTTATSDARPSIAVLPFENRSRLEDDAFFVDGIHDDILTQLTKVGALKVIARTSVEQFRDTKLTTKQIGERLGVTKVLEGGVQRAGNRVRVTVQLIDAATDAHVWAENYDRELSAENIFAIQSEVAAEIAVALETTLTPAERLRVNSIATKNLAAWEAYQLGRQRMGRRTSSSLAEAEEYLRQAIDHDPTFATAYAALADAIWLKADISGQPLAPAVAEAEGLVEKALKFDPNLAEAHTTRAKFAQDRRDFQLAETEYRRAIELNPNYPTAHQWYAQLLGLQGRDAEAMARTQRAAELDPLSVLLRTNVAWGLSGLGRFDEALTSFNTARNVDPSSPLPYAGIAAVYATAYGRLDLAVPFAEKAIQLDASGSRHQRMLAQILLDLGDDARAWHWAERAAGDGSAHMVRAYFHLYRGEHAKALSSARKALEFDARDHRALALLDESDSDANEALAARSRYARAFPELLERRTPEVDPSNYAAAIDLVDIEEALGQREHAGQLLDRSESLIRSFPRMGPWGYGIADAQILALRGEDDKALAALHAAMKAGWRGPAWRYYRDFDSNLASIRNEPEFKAVFADIERDMAQQRARLAARPKDAQLELTQVAR